MLNKKVLISWGVCSVILVIGIHYLDGMLYIDDWPWFLTGALLGVLLLIIASIIFAVVFAAFPFNSNMTPNRKQVGVFVPMSTILLTVISLIAFIVSRPSYERSNAAGPVFCHTVKEGKFRLDDYMIEREKDTQIETNTLTKEKSISKIRWLSDCEYELINAEDLNDITKVKVIAVTEEGYTCVAVSGNRTTKHELKILRAGN